MRSKLLAALAGLLLLCLVVTSCKGKEADQSTTPAEGFESEFSTQGSASPTVEITTETSGDVSDDPDAPVTPDEKEYGILIPLTPVA